MTPNELIARFDDLAEAPNGVERLRTLVLLLGVTGKLVPQDRSDAPIAPLVERAKRMLAEGPAVRGRAAAVEKHAGDGALFVGEPDGARVPAGWMVVSLSAIARLESGHTPDKDVPGYWNGDIPWIGIRDARLHHGGHIQKTERFITQAGVDNSAARLLPAGTVCLSRTASIGYVVVMDAPMCTSQDFVNWVCTDALLPDYLRTLFLAEQGALHRFSKGAVHKTIYFPEAKAFHLLLPPLAEQKRIVARVDELMKLIDQLDAARTRREQARVAFRDSALSALQTATTAEEVELAWVRVRERFDDVSSARGDIGRLRALVMRLAVRGALSTTDDRDLAPVVARQAEPEYEIAAKWGWAPLTRLFRCRLGKMLDKAKNLGVARPYLRNANVRWWSFDLSDVLEMRIEDDEVDDVSVCRGDLVICEGGEPGRCAVWDGDAPFVVQKALHRARPGPGVDPYFYALHLRADASDGRLERLFTGATIKHLTGQALDKHFVAVPPLAEQKRIVARVDDLMKLIDDVEREQRQREDLHGTFAAAAVHHLDA